jgi:hypothetical protein
LSDVYASAIGELANWRIGKLSPFILRGNGKAHINWLIEYNFTKLKIDVVRIAFILHDHLTALGEPAAIDQLVIFINENNTDVAAERTVS